MKAAVIDHKGVVPQYTDFPEPIPQNEDEIIMYVKAAAIKHLDKSVASGKHYSSNQDAVSAKIIGGDGVGLLPDGTRVFAIGMGGMAAEKAIIRKDSIVKIPDVLDDVTAAALPNAVAGSAMALRFRALMKEGETVLINGATGVTGTIAVQIARHYGAKRIIVTGRNEQSLTALQLLGADEIVSLQQSEESFTAQLKAIHQTTPVDIVLDYLWGRPAELVLSALKGKGSFTHRTRYISIGSMAGDNVQLSAEILRSTDLQLSGSGLGSWTKEEMRYLFTAILPEMFELAEKKQLIIETISLRLRDVDQVWNIQVPSGKRLVVTI